MVWCLQICQFILLAKWSDTLEKEKVLGYFLLTRLQCVPAMFAEPITLGNGYLPSKQIGLLLAAVTPGLHRMLNYVIARSKSTYLAKRMVGGITTVTQEKLLLIVILSAYAALIIS